MDLDLRKVRYFVAVAQLGHFGRAAEQLYIAQPVLSRQIRALESELGCDLFTRTTRSVALTAAGEQLLAAAPPLLTAADGAARRAQAAARGPAVVVVGFAPGLAIAPAAKAFSTRHAGVEVQLVQLPWFEHEHAVRDGRVDVGYVRDVGDRRGLQVVDVGCEPSVACLPRGHRLAGRRRLALADLASESLFDGQARRSASVEEKLEQIAAGTVIALLPRSAARLYARSDLVFRPVADGRSFVTSLVTLPGHGGPAAWFWQVARDVLAPGA